MVRDFDHFHVGGIRSRTADLQTAAREQRLVLPVELVTVTVALANFRCAVDAVCKRIGLDYAGPRTKAHRPAHLLDAEQFAEFVDHPMLSGGIELAGVGILKTTDVASEFNT